ncbi:integrase catalytic subunit, partial [mine drainage metagenome]
MLPTGAAAVGGPDSAIPSPAAIFGEGPRSGPASTCEPYRSIIEEKLSRGLTVQRIYQDLLAESGFKHSYDSIKRFARRLCRHRELPFRRMECPPGQEAQVDFGSGALIGAAGGRRRRSQVFRMVLSHSRKGYSEAVYRQTTEDFLGCMENAFWHFGGVPQTVVIDNLRAAVVRPDWYDPELNPRLEAFCRHYGTVILPTKPYTP